MRIVHESTDNSAIIRIEGLKEALRVLHLTDTHLNLIDERDAAHMASGQTWEEKFAARRKDVHGKPISTASTFAELMKQARDEKPDLLTLTGDIASFPSQANLDLISTELSKAKVPWLYTTGNHDWQFPDLKPSEALRLEYYPRLAPLHLGQAFQAEMEIKGVKFIAIDDSTYQVNEEQLAFTKRELGKGLPTVLLIHIPISLATLRPATLKRWNAPILIGDPHWEEESRDRWHAGRDSKETLEFVRQVSTAPNLAAVLCGHIHFQSADNLSPRAVQYVGLPGYEAGFRRVELLPL